MIDSQGWLSSATHTPSPNHNQRPESTPVELLVIHNISLPPNQFGGGYIQRFFCNQLAADEHPYFATIADLQVSAHLLIDRQGKVTQFVPFSARAWHAGASDFCGRDNCNDFSIGIELEGADDTPYSDAQYRCLVEVTRELMGHFPGITPERIVGHSDIAPGRKTDPGSAFDWPRYKNQL
ncbi:1,6-anhydro-N-acetylmuramyl-L-alanine amidase AmpD [bacterium SCSIO 12696]|nr:1,6-anhydro-N-acetylmuramyl-L-alanine amidase AmpD [bacterium SCSIO 12696]